MTGPLERTRIALISCSASKLNRPAPAHQLYTSPLFRKSVGYATTYCDGWLILSAKHGLVEPDTILEPYDQRLTVEPRQVEGRTIPTTWAEGVSRGLADIFDLPRLWSTTFVVLAGGVYERNLRALVPAITMDFPLAGMQIGERLHWLTEQISMAELDPERRGA